MKPSPRFPATREDALDRLDHFAPHAGHAYATGRNTDFGPDQPGAVSRLSPYLRYRLLTEEEVVAAVLDRHSLAAAEKYVQEVLWRTYWKGWLEMRPSVWTRFLGARDRWREALADDAGLADAQGGRTGIDGFDHWARELVETGYLHNHARMWFASIWIFTLRLPWELGADFFLRHLIDADAASNTLSWRWVAGLQTPGKSYLATRENIARFTNGRFAPQGLATQAFDLSEEPVPPALPLPPVEPFDAAGPALLLVTHEDMVPEIQLIPTARIAGAVVTGAKQTLWGKAAGDFVERALSDTASRVRAQMGCDVAPYPQITADQLIASAQFAGVRQVLTAYAPVGPMADNLAQLGRDLKAAGITLYPVRRTWDTDFWPHATKGFFPFKEKIPAILQQRRMI
ncbi:FAD-binding domain-containing protein [Sphingorhabdus contaminans]|uniref:DNA photolyase FAD-binding protein n=1 Tax=Sphingorhabdus contaminans TaxID=1343899 RepID=A0A553WGY4_9SPHN|nr:FAD-binding domain-containing protein [Sphingorhabdus contaminans]TSB03959.1 DNA photolyase FAD-binding protein [Sphingorhabdus contaminans]